jgi:hypothetical protein
MFSPIIIIAALSLTIVWCVGTVFVSRKIGPRIWFLAWLPPVVILAFLVWYLMLGFACAYGNGCV